jgi:hypothetical protein
MSREWRLEVSRDRGVALIWDSSGSFSCTIIEIDTPGCYFLPIEPPTKKQHWVDYGDDCAYWRSYHSSEMIADFLNRCRWWGAKLAEGTPLMWKWWMDGVNNIRGDDAERFLLMPHEYGGVCHAQ